jgi:hypothetical protein
MWQDGFDRRVAKSHHRCSARGILLISWEQPVQRRLVHWALTLGIRNNDTTDVEHRGQHDATKRNAEPIELAEKHVAHEQQ